MESTPHSADVAAQDASDIVVATNDIMPFFSDHKINVINSLVLAPLAIWTILCIYSLCKNVPSPALKWPAILIFFGPLMLQICNTINNYVESEHNLALIALAAKIYIGALFCSFYLMIREVVFYEHLLQTDAMNADANFEEKQSMSEVTTHSSQVSGGVFSLVPR